MITRPCSIHDPVAAVEHARRLQGARERHVDTLEIVMRVYFEKARTTVGWKGLINDPYLDETYRADEGLRIGRQRLLEINRLGMPAGREFLLASGLSAAVGFKNGTAGNILITDLCLRPGRLGRR